MLNYQPLYGNPTSLGFAQLENQDSPTPDKYLQDPEDWANFQKYWEEVGAQYDVTDAQKYEMLSEDAQASVDAAVDLVKRLIEEEVSDEEAAVFMSEIKSATDFAERELFTASDENAVKIIDEVLLEVYNKVSDEFSDALFNAIVALQNERETNITAEQLRTGLIYFNSVAFPVYQPEELIACIFLAFENETDKLESEFNSMITDDLRPDALCSPKNAAIVLAQFGQKSATKFNEFCAKSPNERLDAVLSAEGNGLAGIFGISESKFVDYVMEAFDNATADKLAAMGSQAMIDLVGTVITDPISNIVNPPKKEDKSPSGEAASLVSTPLAIALAAGSLVGLTLLARKIHKS